MYAKVFQNKKDSLSLVLLSYTKKVVIGLEKVI